MVASRSASLEVPVSSVLPLAPCLLIIDCTLLWLFHCAACHCVLRFLPLPQSHRGPELDSTLSHQFLARGTAGTRRCRQQCSATMMTYRRAHEFCVWATQHVAKCAYAKCAREDDSRDKHVATGWEQQDK